MSEPCDFYWGDVLRYECRSAEGLMFTFAGPVVGFYRNEGFVDHVCLNIKPGHAEGFPVNSCVHASDGAPLRKFGGIRDHEGTDVILGKPYAIGFAEGIEHANAMLGAEEVGDE